MGWTVEGVPTQERLAQLGIAELSVSLYERG
jgi:hypothetical protein